jgi:hypothetical protein
LVDGRIAFEHEVKLLLPNAGAGAQTVAAMAIIQ